MAAETIGFAVQPEDKAELDRLVRHFGNGNRSEFLREAIKVMAARERGQRLAQVVNAGQAESGGPISAQESLAITRASMKGLVPPDAQLRTFSARTQKLITRAAERHAGRNGRPVDPRP